MILPREDCLRGYVHSKKWKHSTTEGQGAYENRSNSYEEKIANITSMYDFYQTIKLTDSISRPGNSMRVPGAMNDEEIQANIKKYDFYHTINLTDLISTPGTAYPIPAISMRVLRSINLRGKRVRDIGCRDGLFSFEADKARCRGGDRDRQRLVARRGRVSDPVLQFKGKDV